MGTAARQGRGDGKGDEVLNPRLAELAASVTDPPVRLVKVIGDAVMLVAPEPRPLVEAMLQLAALADAEGHGFPQLRIGIASGQAFGTPTIVPPATDGVRLVDTFTRTVGAGDWGTPDRGGAYALAGGHRQFDSRQQRRAAESQLDVFQLDQGRRHDCSIQLCFAAV